MSPLGKRHHKVITFSYQVEYNESSKVRYNKANYNPMNSKLAEIEWNDLFKQKDIALSWKHFWSY